MGESRAPADARHHLSDRRAPRAAATAIYVAYRTDHLDLAWIPGDASVIVVHNDNVLDPGVCGRMNVVHVDAGGNIGFGAAVNLALPLVTTERVVLVNPDTRLRAEHWDALTSASPDEIVTVPLVEADGRPTIVQSAHLSPAALVLSAFRIGRFVPGRLHRRSIGAGSADVTTAAETWTSGACVSISTALLRDVGGFDDSYFLYFEDADLGRRIGRVHPHVRMRTAAVPPGVHGVGGSADQPSSRSEVELHRVRSAYRYAATAEGWAWRAAASVVALRVAWLNGRQRAAS